MMAMPSSGRSLPFRAGPAKWLMVLLIAAGCASSAPRGGDPGAAMAPGPSWEEESREAMEALRRAVEASYDRERALAERLRQMEEQNAVLLQEVQALRVQSASNRAQLDSMDVTGAHILAAAPPVAPAADERVLVLYQQALADYRERRYSEAMDRLARILAAAPYSEWADNAQYWRGECLYGLGQYRQALTEFTKVFAYEKTEKADDAQLKVARCYAALGERERALQAFQQLLDEYSDSEYTEAARQEMRRLRGN